MEACCKIIEIFKVSSIWDEHISLLASTYGHVDCLKYAHENGCSWHPGTTTFASNGYLDCLKYAHENGCSWNKYSTTFAASNGHLDCLKYAHENGCPWNDFTISYAAENGHLDCLKYSYENGCPLTLNEEQTILSNLEKHSSKINLDDKWWRSFLFEKDLTSHSILKNLVDTKKEEIKILQEETNLSKDITQ